MDIQRFVSELHNKGLLVEYFGDIGPYAHGYTVGKPTTTPGNRRPGWEEHCYWGDLDIQIDAPTAHVFPVGDEWIFEVWEYIPGPGPGDFRKGFTCLEDVVIAISEYYFGDPMLMNPSYTANA